MSLPTPIANIITQATRVDSVTVDRVYGLGVTIVTPREQLTLTTVSGMAIMSMFGVNHSDDIRINGLMAPGLYLNKVLANKDNLYAEVITRIGLTQTVTRYRAIPLGDGDPRVAGSHTSLNNLSSIDSINMVEVTFQLMDPGYSLLKNELVADINLMATVKDVMRYHLTKFGEGLPLLEADSFRGVDIVEPIDNEKIYKQIIIPPSTKLIHLPRFLQTNDEYGVYSTGLGSYYRKGMWYVYPLFRTGIYNNSPKVLDIYKLPDNVAPTLKRSYLTDRDRVTTIITTGIGKVINDKDISKQNKGVGKRIMSSDILTGDTGYYYKNGLGLLTREDSVSEFKTSSRGSTEEYVAFDPKPTNNICNALSLNALNEGYILEIQWDNSDYKLVKPGMPLRYFYLDDSNRLVYVEGTVLGIRVESIKDNQNPANLVFREKSKLQLWLSSEITEVS